MISEPYKIKEVKLVKHLEPYHRWNILKRVGFNTFRVPAENVAFDMVVKGMSAWSQDQKAGLMVGDEAYAGASSYYVLVENLHKIFGIDEIVPSHSGIGAEKLLAVTRVGEGSVVPHNRGAGGSPMVDALRGRAVDVSASRTDGGRPPRADLDILGLQEIIAAAGPDKVPYIHVDLAPEALGSIPISLSNLLEVRRLSEAHSIPLVLDISNVMGVAWWMRANERPGVGLRELAKELVELGDVVIMDASQEARSDTGGFVATRDPDMFDAMRNQVVVFEGLHTYGGMSGRAMEVFAVGVGELGREEYTRWHQAQLASLHERLLAEGVPASRGVKTITLDAAVFFPHISANHHPRFTLAACLYIQGGVRARLDGAWGVQAGVDRLHLELPRHAYTGDHLQEIADTIVAVWEGRNQVRGLELLNEPEFVDEACFGAANERLFVGFDRPGRSAARMYEPHKIAIFEPVKPTDKEYRRGAIAEAGYNTFLLRSDDVYIDFLTDSGTTAMSTSQWEGMTDSEDTPYSTRHYRGLVDTFRDILGFEHIIPTHQGRAAEHIMSQVMIRPGQSVPGNMYFTTTKLHQEIAGGVFVDVIVDQAHDPSSTFPWKGNVDPAKLLAEINRVGAENVAYLSFENTVNMAGGQPFSMENLREISAICQAHCIPLMFDATRCVENAHFIKLREPGYAHRPVREILREMMSYGDGCTISCKKDFLVNMGGILACNDAGLARRFNRMLRIWEGEVTNGGMDSKDLEALKRGLLESLDDDYIRVRIHQTHELGRKLIEAGVPIVLPPGSHAIFLDAKRFLPHVDQDEYPAQALAAAVYIETGVRAMERGNVSKGRDPRTGENYRPPLELVRCTIPRRVYTNAHMDFVVEGIKRLYSIRERISGLEFTYEPKMLRFFQSRFRPLRDWDF